MFCEKLRFLCKAFVCPEQTIHALEQADIHQQICYNARNKINNYEMPLRSHSPTGIFFLDMVGQVTSGTEKRQKVF